MTDLENKAKNIGGSLFLKLKNPKALIFFVFFLFSAFLWFLIALNKDYNDEDVINIKFTNLPDDCIVGDNTIQSVVVTVRANGYALLQSRMEKVDLPVELNFGSKKKKFTLRSSQYEKGKSYILTKDIIPLLSGRYGEDVNIVGVFPDSIYFRNVADMYSRKVPVSLDVSLLLNPDYIQSGDMQSIPDSVTISGDEKVIDSIQTVYTCREVIIRSSDTCRTKKVMLKKINDVVFSTTSVAVDVPVEKYTEKTLSVKIQAINFPDTLKYVLLPDNVSVAFKVPLSLYDSISANDFSAIADYTKAKNGKVEIRVHAAKSNVKLTNYSPLTSEFHLATKSRP